MTQPNSDGGKGKTEEKPAAVEVLDVVDYLHRDPILGGERRELGVVVGVDDQGVDIVPLAGHRVRVKPGEVARLSVDDV